MKQKESQETDLHKYGQLTSTKVQWQFNGEWRVFSINIVGTIGHHMQKNNELQLKGLSICEKQLKIDQRSKYKL